MFTRTALIGRPRPRQSLGYAVCAVRFTSARAAIIRYRRRRRMQTAKRARFGLASSTCSALNKPLRVVGSYGRLALLGRKPKSASRTSPITFAVLSRWSEWPPHDGAVCPVPIKRDADRVTATASAEINTENERHATAAEIQRQKRHCSRCPVVDPTRVRTVADKNSAVTPLDLRPTLADHFFKGNSIKVRRQFNCTMNMPTT